MTPLEGRVFMTALPASAINRTGTIVSTTNASAGTEPRPTTWVGSTAVDLGTPGAGGGSALGINQAGDIVGSASPGGGAGLVPALWRAGSMSSLDKLGADHAEARAINDAGQIVGLQPAAGHRRAACAAVARRRGERSGLAGDQSAAYGINNAGDIVGYAESRLGRSVPVAILWRGGKMIDLDTQLDRAAKEAGWRHESASAIHDQGVITGMACNKFSKLLAAYRLDPLAGAAAP